MIDCVIVSVCLCVWVYVSVYIYIYISMFVITFVSTDACVMYVCVCMSACTYLCVYVWVYVWLSVANCSQRNVQRVGMKEFLHELGAKLLKSSQNPVRPLFHLEDTQLCFLRQRLMVFLGPLVPDLSMATLNSI